VEFLKSVFCIAFSNFTACFLKFGAFTYYPVIQGTSLLSYVSCHQGICLTFIDPVHFLTYSTMVLLGSITCV